VTDTKTTAIIKSAVTFLLIVIVASVETSLFPYIRIAGTIPSVLIYIVTATAVFEGPAAGLACGTVAGFILDGINGLSFYYYTIFMVFTGAFIGTVSPNYFRKRIPTAMLWGAIFWFACEFLRFFFSIYIFGKSDFSPVFSIIIPGSFYSFIISPFVIYPVSLMYRKMKKEPVLFR
jgi:rod shape-determining protein MreD